MPQVIGKNSIMISKEPMVLLPLKEWKDIEENVEELEDAARYYRALSESKGDELISLEKVRRKYNLK